MLLLNASRLDTEFEIERPPGKEGGVVAPVDDVGDWAKPPLVLELELELEPA